MVKLQGIIFIIVAVVLYFITSGFLGGWSIIVSLLLSAIITFSLVRNSWEQNILKNLSQVDKDNIRRRMDEANIELAKSREHFNKELETSDYDDAKIVMDIHNGSLDSTFAITVGILVDFDKDSERSILKPFREAGRSPLDKGLIRKLDGALHKAYREVYGNMATSVPFPRMYAKIIKEVYLTHINDDGVLARLGQLKNR